MEPFEPTWTEPVSPLGEGSVKPPWKPQSIALLGALTGFGLAGILTALNWERLGKPELKNKGIALSVLAYMPFLVLAMFLPDKVSRFVWFINVAVSYGMISGQKLVYAEHVANDGETARIWKPALLGGTALVGVIFAVVMGSVFYYEQVFDDAYVALEDKRYEEAEAGFKRYVAEYPDDPAGHQNLVAVAFRSGDLSSAESHAEAMLASDPKNPDVLAHYVAVQFDIGATHHEAERHAEAKRFYEKALQHDPSHEDARHNLELLDPPAD